MSESEKSLYNSKENVLKELLLNYGINSTEHQRRQLLKHIELLIEINKNLNLTRITSVDDALVLHILDSLLPLKVCNEFISEAQNYIDIGTGGGFPGLPLAIMSDNKTLLVDSIGKKISAVQSMIDEIGLNERVRAEKLRAEEIPNAYKQKFDFVTFRAVAKTNILLEYAEPKKLQRAKLNYREKLEWQNQIRLLQEEGNCGMFHVKHSVLLNKLGQTEDK